MSDLVHFLNGKFVSEEELLISPRDLGFSRGYAVADFIVTYHNKPFKLSEHIDRLFNSADIISLKVPWSKTQITDWVLETLNKNDKETEKTIKIVISGGVSHSLHQSGTPTIAIIVSKRNKHPESSYINGVRATAVNFKRQYPEAKHTNYIEAVKQLATTENEGIEDILFYDDSQVYEGSGTNIFAVIDNKLITPKSNIVPGITRNTLLDILKLNIPIEMRDFTFDELQNAKEVYVTGSNSEIRGVIEINGKTIGDGKVGDITKESLRQYREYIEQISKV